MIIEGLLFWVFCVTIILVAVYLLVLVFRQQKTGSDYHLVSLALIVVLAAGAILCFGYATVYPAEFENYLLRREAQGVIHHKKMEAYRMRQVAEEEELRKVMDEMKNRKT